MIYQPGKSRLIYMTGVLMTLTGAGTNSHMGLFSVDTSNPPVITEGTYLRCDGTNLIWEDVTQSGTDSVIQSSWNIDKFNGSGPSGKTLTIANAAQTLLLVLDQEWLGVGRIRCGFIIDGVIYYGHQFLHNNFTVQYTKTPRIYLSYYIKGTVTNAMRQMCSTSIIEDGYFSTGRINNVANSVSSTTPFVTVGTVDDRVLLGLRVQTGITDPTKNFPLSTFFLKNLSFYYLGSGHSILVDNLTENENRLNPDFKIGNKIRLLTFVNEKAIPINDDFRYEMYHLSTGEEEGIYANGILTESFNLSILKNYFRKTI